MAYTRLSFPRDGRLGAYVDPVMDTSARQAETTLNLSDVWNPAVFLDHPSASAITVSGVLGRGPLRFIGQMTRATGLTSGVAFGTAGSGTTPTSIAKPTGAANWTANNLVGRWVRLTGGAGAGSEPTHNPVLRVITANTTTAFTVASVAGMDSTTTFEIVTLDSSISGGVSFQDSTNIELVGFNLTSSTATSLVTASGCRSVTLRGCNIASNTSAASILTSDCDAVALEYCKLGSGADTSIQASRVSIKGCYASAAGTISILDADKVVVSELLSVDAVSHALSIVRCRYANLEASCTGGGDSALYLESIDNMEASGGLLTGTGNTGYGVEIAASGRYSLVGCTVTGTTNDVLFMGNAVSWANLSSSDYGIAEEHAGSAIGFAAYTKSLKYGNYLYYGNIDVSGRMLLYGYLNPSQSNGLTATGSAVGDSLQLGAVAYAEVTTTPSGTGVRLPAGAALPGVNCTIYNAGANTLTIYAPASGTVDGGASITLASTKRILLVATGASGLAWRTVAVSP